MGYSQGVGGTNWGEVLDILGANFWTSGPEVIVESHHHYHEVPVRHEQHEKVSTVVNLTINFNF